MLKTEYSDALLLTKMELQREKVARKALLDECAMLRKQVRRRDTALHVAFMIGCFVGLFMLWLISK